MYAELKKARIQAMKDKNAIAKSLYSTILGDVDKIAKDKQVDVDTLMVETVAKKMASTIKENIKIYTEKGVDASKEQAELELLSDFLPSYLSESDTRDVVSKFIESAESPNIKQVMQFLNQNFRGRVDMGLASKIAKELL